MKILVSLVAVLAVARATPRNYLPPETEGSNGYLGASNQGELAPYEDNVPSGEYLSNLGDEDLSERVYLPPGPQNAYLPSAKNSVLPVFTSDTVKKTYLPPARPQNTYLTPGSSKTKPKNTYLPSRQPQTSYLPPGPTATIPLNTYLPSKIPKNTYLPPMRSQNTYLPPGPAKTEPKNTYLPPMRSQNTYLPPGPANTEPKNTYLPPMRSQNTYLPPGPANTEPKNTYLPSTAPQNSYLPPDVISAKSKNTYLPPQEPQNAYLPPKSFDPRPGNIYSPSKSTKGTYLPPPSSWNTPQRSNPAPSQEYHSNQENFTRQSSRTSSSWTSSSGNSNIVPAWSKAKWMVNGDSTREHTGTNQYGGQSLRHSVGYGYPHTDEIVNPKYDYQYRVSDSKSGNDFEHTENRDGDTVWGMYSVVLPDGRKQTVKYTADGNGYQPIINYEDTDKGYASNYKEIEGPY